MSKMKIFLVTQNLEQYIEVEAKDEDGAREAAFSTDPELWTDGDIDVHIEEIGDAEEDEEEGE